MPSYIAAFALQQLQDMEELQRDWRSARARRRGRRHRRELSASAPVEQGTGLWTLPHQTRRPSGVSASTKGATGAS
jgi:hypothetical protein